MTQDKVYGERSDRILQGCAALSMLLKLLKALIGADGAGLSFLSGEDIRVPYCVGMRPGRYPRRQMLCNMLLSEEGRTELVVDEASLVVDEASPTTPEPREVCASRRKELNGYIGIKTVPLFSGSGSQNVLFVFGRKKGLVADLDVEYMRMVAGLLSLLKTDYGQLPIEGSLTDMNCSMGRRAFEPRGSLAHELNTPLHGMKLSLELLESEGLDQVSKRVLFESLSCSIERIESIVAELLIKESP